MDEGTDSIKSTIRSPRIEAASLIVAILSVLVAVYFGIKTENKKEITIRYLTERNLVSIEASKTNGLDITFQGKPVKSPWIASIRIENTGDIPIDQKDIESPTTIIFPNAAVLDARIVEQQPANIDSTVNNAGNYLAVIHKLLNPGDSITIDVFLDGNPSNKFSTFRIAGIKNPVEVLISNEQTQNYVTVIPLPNSAQYSALTLSSLATLALLAFASYIVFDYVASALKSGGDRISVMKSRIERDLNPEYFLITIPTEDKILGAILSCIGNPLKLSAVLDINKLVNLVETKVPVPLISIYKESTGSIAQKIQRLSIGATESQLMAFAKTRFSKKGADALASEIDKIKSRNPTNYLGLSFEQVKKSYVDDALRNENMDTGDLIAGIMAFLISISLISLLGSAWKIILGY
ncbi:hypothetical protein [Azospirillum canadense]|uniref:hypothetical protein n=1 Tax=Azospirillum canadense TaxID=403962 RepID=UPI0022267108|nr:hypothetical protein [Azospirillum canadense]MCW2237554.1 hypothetical protein [Azospirillum canadense]